MSLSLIIPAIILFAMYTYADAAGDVAEERSRQHAWHFWGAWQVALFLAVVSYLVFGLTWWALLGFVCLGILRLPVFNILHNILKGQPWWYVGKTATTDKLIRKIIEFLEPYLQPARLWHLKLTEFDNQ